VSCRIVPGQCERQLEGIYQDMFHDMFGITYTICSRYVRLIVRTMFTICSDIQENFLPDEILGTQPGEYLDSHTKPPVIRKRQVSFFSPSEVIAETTCRGSYGTPSAS
jgi:hypothetical protein